MKVLAEIDTKLAAWLAAQPMFFVASAPLSASGHVNVSPKGMDGTFAVLGPLQVAYLDYFGSGSETIAHLRENGRITLMFPAFDGRPNIVRLYGRGRFVTPDDAEFERLRPAFAKVPAIGERTVIVVEVDRVQESCGYAVPTMQLVEQRQVLELHWAKNGPEALPGYAAEKNATSIDGLPALG